ncbi:cysteine synthase A [Erysipelothrix sp. HDW6B]|uniref:cysteine synthase A n=1 Tax=Erysipelothrix sp. HDW6B TaxID=2714929 RepID=UPI00140DE641|nr:cysteine synthase A [Erysipelothrix sp. HDW6B]QIK85959.1 cysteine synthase A [Erysipelothrix sp. HDW6B]
MKIYKNIRELIGNTPLIALENISKTEGAVADVYAKVEYFNPSGSVKDRAALGMLTKAFEEGAIDKDTVIIEPTSGNTGIGLASIGASLGMKVILTMPETMSVERRNLLKAYGAEVVLTEGPLGMKGAIAKAEELKGSYDNAFIPSQFENYSNAEMHYKTTGPEIFNDTDGTVDILVAGIGTGGTITGTGKFLKEKNADIQVVAVEPASSAVLSGESPSPHKIQGIGAGFVPGILDTKIYDSISKVTDDEAIAMGRRLAREEGLLVGVSSGAAVSAAMKLAILPENKGKTIVVVLPDTGERYLSTPMFAE